MTQLSPIRTLARAYSDGKIDKDKYRSDRTTFFEVLIAGNVTLPVEDEIAKRIADGGTFSDITLQKIAESSEAPAPSKRQKPKGFLDNKSILFGDVGAMVNEISKKLLEEKALAAIGNPETSYEKQRQLVEFANSIAIRDQRITMPDAP